MLRASTLLYTAAIVLLSSCAMHGPREAPYVRVARDSERTGICSIHRVPLVRRSVYKYSHFDTGTVCWDEAGGAVSQKYPNVLDPSYSPTRSRDYHDPAVVRICPVCQRLFDREVKTWRPQNI
jgi:hypothetical protein